MERKIDLFTVSGNYLSSRSKGTNFYLLISLFSMSLLFYNRLNTVVFFFNFET